MQKLTRPSLAALVCPSAPFLAPRLLRSLVTETPNKWPSAKHATYTTTTATASAQRSDGKNIVRMVKTKRVAARTANSRTKRGSIALRESSDEGSSQLLELTEQLLLACEARNVRQVMDLYPALLEAGVLSEASGLARRITQTLHVRLRYSFDEVERADMLAFTRRVATDLRLGALAPHSIAYVHLLGIYKDCRCYEEGHALWLWLVDQDERHVSAAVYGAAIELMAYGRLMALPGLERLYAEALQRFPGTFAAYHLSPDAVVPDRTQPTLIPGIPMMLLQGILTARILARDWRNAYLALHVAMRLYPTAVPPRFFELFMSERPLAEGYTAYMLACRAGIVIRPTHVTALLAKIRAAIGSMTSMADRFLLVRAITNALYASVQAGGELQGIYVAILIQSMAQLLPDGMLQQNMTPETVDIRDAIVAKVREIMLGLMQAGMKHEIHPFGALFALAGKLHVPDLLTTTLDQIKASGLKIGPIVTREAITAAGFLGNKTVIEQLWGSVVKDVEAPGLGISAENWITLTKACRRAGHQAYLEQQLTTFASTLGEGVEDRIRAQMNRSDTVPDVTSFKLMSMKELASEFKILDEHMINVRAVLMSGKSLSTFDNPFHMHLNPYNPALGFIHDLRAIYDQCTIDPHQPPPPPQDKGRAPIPTSRTNIPLDELRFLNWVTIFEMMDDAETYEIDRKIQIQAAREAGNATPTKLEVLRLHQDATVTYCSVPNLRSRIVSLRGAPEVPLFRYTESTPKNKSSPKRRDLPPVSENSVQVPRSSNLESVGKIQKPARDDSEPAHKGPAKIPTMTFYVGLQSKHDALAKPKKKLDSTQGMQGLNLTEPEKHNDSSTPVRSDEDGNEPVTPSTGISGA